MTAITQPYDALIVSPHVDYTTDGRAKIADNDLSPILPLGAMYVVQHLNDAGYRVAFLHLSSYMSQPENQGVPLKDILARFPAKFCAIQCNWFLYIGGTAEVSRTYRELFPTSKIIAGGIHASSCHQQMLDNIPELDAVVLGEGEQVLENMLKGRPLDSLSSLAWREGTKSSVIKTANTDHIPIKDVAIIDPRQPCFHGVKPSSYFYLNVTRGTCPHLCTYCVANNKDVFTRKLEHLSLSKIIDQLKIYKECNVKEVFLGETQFITKPFLRELSREIIKNKIDIYLRLETHPILFDEDTTKLLIEAGFRRFTMGCESGDDGMLSYTGRKYSTSKIINAVETIVKHGGIVLTSWIINLPNETRRQFEDTLRLMDQVAAAGGFVYWIENLHVLPGSPLEINYAQHNISLLLKSFADWRRWSFLAKSNIDFEDALAHPETYLTHLAKETPPREMMERFIQARLHARDLVDPMIKHLLARRDLPQAIVDTELFGLRWYHRSGHRMLVF